MLSLIFAAHAAALADCEEQFPESAVRPFAEGVFKAFSDVDDPKVFEFYDELMRRLPCTSETLSPQTIGSIHLAVAIHAVSTNENGQVGPALAGLLSAVPGYQFSDAVFPKGHPIPSSLSYAQNLLMDGEVQTIPAFKGWLEVDRHVQQEIPVVRNRLIQAYGTDGGLLGTIYLRAHEDLRPWLDPLVIYEGQKPNRPRVAAAPRPEPPARPPGTGGKSPRIPLLVGGLTAAAGAGVLTGVSRMGWDAYHANTPQDYEVANRQAWTTVNAPGFGAVGCGLLAVGLGIGAVLTW